MVGFANSITNTADGWVTPGEARPALRAPGTPVNEQMLYRFAARPPQHAAARRRRAVSQALPAGAVTDAGPWLTAQQTAAGNGAIMEPFVIAFALIGLVMAVLIVGNVVSGAVVAQYQRIGVLKSIGLTPAQVVAVYLSRIGWPALAGCLAGVVAGNLLAIPVLQRVGRRLRCRRPAGPVVGAVIAPAGMLALTMLAALGPALRAGRLSAAQAIAAGRAPAGRARVRRAPARRPAAAAAPGRPRPRRAVRQARAHRW